jgi:hypothetical protein
VNAGQGDCIRDGDEFYRSLNATAEVSARRILPLVFDVVAVHSVVDVHHDLFRYTLRFAQPRLGRWFKTAPQVLRRTLLPTASEG